MPVDLLDVLESLVDEEQLRGQLLHSLAVLAWLSLAVLLQGQVPKGNLEKQEQSKSTHIG